MLTSLHIPFMSAMHPQAEEIDRQTRLWLERFKLLRDESARSDFDRANQIGLTARVMPTGSVEKIGILNDWLAWLFLLDDHLDEAFLGKNPHGLRVVLGGLTETMQQPYSPTRSKLDASLFDLMKRVEQHMPPGWSARFTASAISYFDGCVLQAQQRVTGYVPNVAEYARLRRKTSALESCIDLIEVIEASALPDAVREHRVVARLVASANDVVAWTNDYYSYPDAYANSDVHNLVAIIEHQAGLSVEQAAHQAAEMINATVCEYQELEQRLPRFDARTDANLQIFLGGLRTWMRGHLDWSIERHRQRAAVPTHQAA